jgi:hypothetical protein
MGEGGIGGTRSSRSSHSSSSSSHSGARGTKGFEDVCGIEVGIGEEVGIVVVFVASCDGSEGKVVREDIGEDGESEPVGGAGSLLIASILASTALSSVATCAASTPHSSHPSLDNNGGGKDSSEPLLEPVSDSESSASEDGCEDIDRSCDCNCRRDLDRERDLLRARVFECEWWRKCEHE